MKHRTCARLALVAIAVSVSACGGNSASTLPSTLNAAAPLINSLTGSIPGLSQAQAALGLGSMLGLAKAKMPAGQYSQLAGAIPGADALVNEAVKKGLPAAPTSRSSVGQFLSKAGISTQQVSQIASSLTQSIAGKVPADVVSSLTQALL